MKRRLYRNKLIEVLDCFQFQEIVSVEDRIALKIENNTKSALLDLKKNSLLGNKIDRKLTSTGAQPVRIYGKSAQE